MTRAQEAVTTNDINITEYRLTTLAHGNGRAPIQGLATTTLQKHVGSYADYTS